MLLLLFVLLLSGCTTEYAQEDIYAYIEQEYALEDVKVSEDRKAIKGKDGYTDYIWEVTAGDIKFRVLDDYHWSGEVLSNDLTDDYKQVMLKEYYDSAILPHFTLDEKEMDGLYSSILIGKFNTKDELIQLYEELKNFQTYVAQKGYDIPSSFAYDLQMQSPIRDNIPSYTVDNGDSYGKVTDIDEDEVEEAMNKYMQSYINYNFNDLYEKFTEEEIIEAVSNSDQQVAIIKGESMIFYDDLLAMPYGSYISFGTLYEILKRENFDVKGNSEHYSFTDANQNVYEISYDFINADGTDDKYNHYYYLKNGVPVKMEANFYNYFYEKQIEEICGLKLYIGTPE